jgi:hypothetical protein
MEPEALEFVSTQGKRPSYIYPAKEKGIVKIKLLLAIACLILAIVIFVFAEGARRVYSGGVFALIGLVSLYLATKKKS